MKKEMLMIVFVLLVSSVFVYAVGESTGGDTDNTDDVDANVDDSAVAECNVDSDCMLKEVSYCCGDQAETRMDCYGVEEDPPQLIDCVGEQSCPSFATVSGCFCADDSKCEGVFETTTDRPPTDVASTRASIVNKKASHTETYKGRNCEDYDTRAERIRCRLSKGEDYKSPQGTVPEACKLTSNTGRCVSFYSVVRTCYKLEGEAKDRCFKRAAGFRKARLNDELPEERPQKARDYIVALLYDLQERIEYHAEDGNIDPDVAAEMIDLIVEIKGDILNGEGKDVVKPKLLELRKMWNDATILEDEDETNNDNGNENTLGTNDETGDTLA